MKSTSILILLIAGSVAVCAARIIGQQESSSSEESAEVKELMQQIETACYKKSGSSKTFETLSTSFDVVPVCFLTELNIIAFTYDLERLNENTCLRHEFFPKYCPQIRSALPCLEPSINELAKCLDDDDALILHAAYNASKVVLDLVCKNDGEVLFQEDWSLDVCINNYSNYSNECGGLVSNATDIMAVSKYGEVECRELAQVRDCMQTKFHECNGPRLMDLFDVFWNAMLDNSPCKNFVGDANEIGVEKLMSAREQRSRLESDVRQQ